MDCSVPALWRIWQRFYVGKKKTQELEEFRFHLEKNLRILSHELQSGTYHHGTYRSFTVDDTKRRDIAVASVKDRFAHRILYEYLVELYDKTFIHDVWSCRKGKGLLAAIERAQSMLQKCANGFFWRADIHKFFDSVDQTVLTTLLMRRVSDSRLVTLLQEVIGSYEVLDKDRKLRERESSHCRRGIPIGNVTSQIFANIYLHELDRFVKHHLRIKHYLRYGDDFVLFGADCSLLEQQRIAVQRFLLEKLHLVLHTRNDVLFPCAKGLRFLGCEISLNYRNLCKHTYSKMLQRLSCRNVSSYRGLIYAHESREERKVLDWCIMNFLEELH